MFYGHVLLEFCPQFVASLTDFAQRWRSLDTEAFFEARRNAASGDLHAHDKQGRSPKVFNYAPTVRRADVDVIK